MEKEEKLVFQPMDQFKVTVLHDSVAGWQLWLVLAIGALLTVIPILFAIWLGRFTQSRWVYLWGTLLTIVMIASFSILQNLAVDQNPRFFLVLIEMIASWFPIDTM